MTILLLYDALPRYLYSSSSYSSTIYTLPATIPTGFPLYLYIYTIDGATAYGTQRLFAHEYMYIYIYNYLSERYTDVFQKIYYVNDSTYFNHGVSHSPEKYIYYSQHSLTKSGREWWRAPIILCRCLGGRGVWTAAGWRCRPAPVLLGPREHHWTIHM